MNFGPFPENFKIRSLRLSNIEMHFGSTLTLVNPGLFSGFAAVSILTYDTAQFNRRPLLTTELHWNSSVVDFHVCPIAPR